MSEYRLPQPPIADLIQTLATKETFELLFNESAVDASLWEDPLDIPRTSAEMLGAYALAGDGAAAELLDWTDSYQKDRNNLNADLSAYIHQALEQGEVLGFRLTDIVTAQYVLPEPVIEGQELLELATQAAYHEFMGLDRLISIAGFLDRIDLAILLKELPDSRMIAKDTIKKSARSVANRLIISDGDEADQEAANVQGFRTAVEATNQTDEVVIYPPSPTDAKIFLRQQDSKIKMVRRNDVENFAAWLKAYEASEVWGSLGFKHIPIEPILSFRFDPKYGSVDNRTVALQSTNFTSALAAADEQTKKVLWNQAKAIVAGLDKIGVNHGHLHEDNLMVVSTDKSPRVYAIDFDKAFIRKNLLK